jgi:hypothetical protein
MSRTAPPIAWSPRALLPCRWLGEARPSLRRWAAVGAFFTNVQIMARGLDASATRQALIRTVRALAAEQGLVASAGEETADRTILV